MIKCQIKIFYKFLFKAFNIKHILNKYNSYYIFCSSQYIDIFIRALKKNHFVFTSIINWVKNKPVLTFADYLYKHEPILYGWYKKHKFYKKGVSRSSIWDYSDYNKNNLHPTMKPIELIKNAILNSTLENMIVYDCFFRFRQYINSLRAY
ncbi:DNA methyltransferase [Brachyspira hyodysenteriae]|uniref:DNA methyltransferase n=1 Tax=Brachyspira hyodysenteriae TaxID=159 RepID=UPI003BF4F530